MQKKTLRHHLQMIPKIKGFEKTISSSFILNTFEKIRINNNTKLSDYDSNYVKNSIYSFLDDSLYIPVYVLTSSAHGVSWYTTNKALASVSTT